MKTKLMVLLLLGASAMFGAARVSVGVYVGGGPSRVHYVAPRPGPGYVWVPGYWTHIGPRPYWRGGYWAPPRPRGLHYVRPHVHRHHHRGHRGR